MTLQKIRDTFADADKLSREAEDMRQRGRDLDRKLAKELEEPLEQLYAGLISAVDFIDCVTDIGLNFRSE